MTVMLRCACRVLQATGAFVLSHILLRKHDSSGAVFRCVQLERSSAVQSVSDRVLVSSMERSSAGRANACILD